MTWFLICGTYFTREKENQQTSWKICYQRTLPWLQPGDFRSWESAQTLPSLFIDPFEHVERFRTLKFAVKRITDIQSTVLSSSEGTAAIHLALNNVQ